MSGWKTWRGNEIMQGVKQNTEQALKIAAEVTGEQSDQLVPLDTGQLKSSKVISIGDMKVVISYGYGNTTGKPEIPYAVKWHEVSADFQRGRQKNYLRKPMKTTAPGALRKALIKQLGGYLK